jgi:hypothetical protein
MTSIKFFMRTKTKRAEMTHTYNKLSVFSHCSSFGFEFDVTNVGLNPVAFARILYEIIENSINNIK